jgi:hypothetical protein
VIGEAGADCNLESEAAKESLGERLPIKLNYKNFCANAKN